MCTVHTARLYERRGLLARIDRALTFLDAVSGETTELEPDMLPFVSVGSVLPAAQAARAVPHFRGQHDHLACRLGG